MVCGVWCMGVVVVLVVAVVVWRWVCGGGVGRGVEWGGWVKQWHERRSDSPLCRGAHDEAVPKPCCIADALAPRAEQSDGHRID